MFLFVQVFPLSVCVAAQPPWGAGGEVHAAPHPGNHPFPSDHHSRLSWPGLPKDIPPRSPRSRPGIGESTQPHPASDTHELQDSLLCFFFLLRDRSAELPIAQDLKIVVSHVCPVIRLLIGGGMPARGSIMSRSAPLEAWKEVTSKGSVFPKVCSREHKLCKMIKW